MDITAKDCLDRFKKLDSNRSTWIDTWDDIIFHCLPNRQPVNFDDTPGRDRSAERYDSTAAKSALDTTASINSMLTNQSSNWFDLKVDDDELMENREVKEWIEKSVAVVRKALDKSNFYTEAHTFYLDIVTLGTGTLYIEKSTNPDKDLNFSARHIREIFIAENDEGFVDTVYRKFKFTVRQMVMKWGFENMPHTVQNQFESNRIDEEHDILHCVFPRSDYDKSKKDKKNMAFHSMWIHFDSEEMLDDGGFESLPYTVARWLKSTGEVYGRSPALASLADIKTLNEMAKTVLMTGQRIADPPIQAPDEMTDVKLDPGSTNYYDSESRGRIEPIVIGANLPINLEMMKMYKESIKDAFFVNQLNLIDHKNMTAEEVRQRSQENARTIGPTFGRLTSEYMDRLMDRILAILFDAGSMPEAPDIIQGKNLELRYISPLAKQQRLTEVTSINYTMNQAQTFGQMNPEVIDNINLDKAFRMLVDLSGTPLGLLNTAEEVSAIRQNRAQQGEMKMQAQMKDFETMINERLANIEKDMALARKHDAQAQKQ